VTAGVYLIFRFRDTLYLLGINSILLILGPLTILIARGSAFYEIDIKKNSCPIYLKTIRSNNNSYGLWYVHIKIFPLIDPRIF
jgi:hypothetical protein